MHTFFIGKLLVSLRTTWNFFQSVFLKKTDSQHWDTFLEIFKDLYFRYTSSGWNDNLGEAHATLSQIRLDKKTNTEAIIKSQISSATSLQQLLNKMKRIVENQRMQFQIIEAQRIETQRVEQRIEAQRMEAQRMQAQRRQAQRIHSLLISENI